MHAHDRGGALQIAADKRHVLIAVHVARIGNHAKFAEARGQDGLGDPVDIALVLHAVADEVRHGEDFQIVVLAEFREWRHPAHGAVFIHDFADDARGAEPRDAREVHGSFGLAGADEHTAVAGAQRKDMARAGEILRLGLWIDGRKNGGGAVGGADTGGDAIARVDGFAEGGAVGGSVDGDMSGRWSSSQRCSVKGRQIRPRACLAMKLMASGVTLSAAMARSPSFSRSSSSTRTTMRPWRMSSTASSTVAKLGRASVIWLK